MKDENKPEFELIDTGERTKPHEDSLETMVISGDFSLYEKITRIFQIPDLKLKLSVPHHFASAKAALQQLLQWDLEYRQTANNSENGSPEKQSFPIRVIFIQDTQDMDIPSLNFIQYLHRFGFLKDHDIFFFLFIDRVASRELRNFAMALGVFFVYDINSTLQELLDAFETLRCTYIDPKIGSVIDDNYYNNDYGPYFSIRYNKIDGKKQSLSTGIARRSKPLWGTRVPDNFSLFDSINQEKPEKNLKKKAQ
jgi:hypothetical protein